MIPARLPLLLTLLCSQQLLAQATVHEHDHSHDHAPVVPAACDCGACPVHGPLVRAAEALHHGDEAAGEVDTLDDATILQYALWDHLEVFKLPAGPKGLEYSEKTQSLAGKKVRITGYMVRNMTPDPDRFMFADRPVVTIEEEYGIVDDVPPNAIHVFVPCSEGTGTTWLPAPITVYGTLEVGNRQEADGRVSAVRIRADYITTGTEHVIIDVCRPLEFRHLFQVPHNHGH